MSQLAPHQQRVVDEKAELDERLKELTAFGLLLVKTVFHDATAVQLAAPKTDVPAEDRAIVE